MQIALKRDYFSFALNDHLSLIVTMLSYLMAVKGGLSVALSFEFLSLGTAHEFQTNDNNDTALVTIINHMMKEEKDEEKTSTRDNYNTTTTATNTFTG